MKTENPGAHTREMPPSSDALASYYGDRSLLFRNVGFIAILSLGWAAAFTYINPLMQLRLKEVGASDSTLGFISGINSLIYSYLVMYFAWKSDHTVSRFGRRIPFLLLATPIIIGAVLLFPLFGAVWLLVALYMVKAIFMDIKAATIPLLNIDCVPRKYLAQVNSINAMVLCATSFLALRYGMGLSDHHRYLPYLAGAAILIITTMVGVAFIKEPPVPSPGKGRFLPWSAMKIAWEDKRNILLMTGTSLLLTSATMYNAWIWLYAGQRINVDHGHLGQIMAWGVLIPLVLSYPAGWLVDRYRGLRIVVLYWIISLAAVGWIVFQVHSPSTLTIGAMIAASLGPFYVAADIKVYRDADPRHVGSVTSTSSCLRGVLLGLATAFSGLLVQWAGGDYRVAFLFGAAMTTLGFLCILIHSRLAARSVELARLAPLVAWLPRDKQRQGA